MYQYIPVIIPTQGILKNGWILVTFWGKGTFTARNEYQKKKGLFHFYQPVRNICVSLNTYMDA